MKYQGKIALVTGASRGIGRAIALRLAQDGAAIGVHYKGNEAAAREVVSTIESAGGRAVALRADLANSAEVRKLWQEFDECFDGLDILVNNAGWADFKPLDNVSESDFDAVFIPGGFEAPDRVRTDKDVLKFVWEMNEGKKLVAAICHGPWVLISAGIVKGRKMTGYMSIKDDIVNAGAEYLDAEVVVDGNLITAPHYRNNSAFMEKVISSLLT